MGYRLPDQGFHIWEASGGNSEFPDSRPGPSNGPRGMRSFGLELPGLVNIQKTMENHHV